MTKQFIPTEIFELARLEEQRWPEMLASLSGPVMAYDEIIAHDDVTPLMPEDVSNTFLKGLQSQSEVLTGFTRVPVSRRRKRFPVLTALPVAYFIGATRRKQTTKVAWDNKFMDIEEIAVILAINEEDVDDADQPIWDTIMPLCEQAAGRAIDEAVFFGVGAPDSWPDSIRVSAEGAGNVASVGTTPSDEGGLVGDHSALLTEIEKDGYDPRRGVAARAFRGLARQARNANGDRFAEINIREGAVDIDGVVYNTDALRGQFDPDGPIAIPYDPSEFVVGIRQDVTWKLLQEAVIQDTDGSILHNLAQDDMVALRLVLRVGWQVANVINYDEPNENDRYPAGVLLNAGASS